jgi:ATP-dependent Clp protease adaptor protein ClpS
VNLTGAAEFLLLWIARRSKLSGVREGVQGMSKSDNRDEGAALKRKGAKKSNKAAPKRRPKSKKLPPYNVILLDDNDHTVDYVVEMLAKLFGYAESKGQEMAQAVDSQGRVIVLTTHKELAELKRDQIVGYGADWRLEKSKGAMSAVIEPAEG